MTAIWQQSGSYKHHHLLWWCLEDPLHSSCSLVVICAFYFYFRLARGREEWDSAALQNANTKCNGLLPVWGPHVPESAFATCLARLKACISTNAEKCFLHGAWCKCLSNTFLYHTGTTHIFRSAQASGSPRTNSTSTIPNCCSSALLPSSRSAWTQEAEAERATSTSSPTSSTLFSTSSTRMCISVVCRKYLTVSTDAELMHVWFMNKTQVFQFDCTSDISHFHLRWFDSANVVAVVQGLRPERRRTSRVSRSNHVRNGLKPHMKLKGRTITPSWPCTSCHLSGGGALVCTSYGDFWSLHMLAKSRQCAQTSTTFFSSPFVCDVN